MYGGRGGSGMEFKYRSVDEITARPPPLPPSSYGYFTEQAIRAGYLTPGVERMHGNSQNPVLIGEAIQRELEKETIREEIIATDMARRRVLEVEVRRCMMPERELGLRGTGDGFDRYSFPPGAGMRFEPRDLSFGQLEGRLLEERIAMSLEKRIGNVARHEIGGRETVPFQERRMEPKIGGPEIIPFQQRAVKPKDSRGYTNL